MSKTKSGINNVLMSLVELIRTFQRQCRSYTIVQMGDVELLKDLDRDQNSTEAFTITETSSNKPFIANAVRYSGLRSCPFLPSEVVEAVLGHLKVRHLKACRLVCKSWNQEACRLLRGKTLLRLTAQDIEQYFSSSKNGSLSPSESLVTAQSVPVKLCIRSTLNDAKLIRKALLNLPTRDSHLLLDIHTPTLPTLHCSMLEILPWVTGLHLSYAEPEKNQNVEGKWLLSTYSSTLTHITVDCGHHYDLLPDWFASIWEFPELEYLEVNTGYDSPYGDCEGQFAVVAAWSQQTRFMHTLQKILQSAQNLRTLKTHGGGRIEIPLLEISPFNLPTLEHLEITGNSFLLGQILATDPPVPLKSLILHLQTENQDLCRQLTVFAPTLERLTIINNDYFPQQCTFEKIPFFHKLTHLSLSADLFLDERLKCFRWLVKMPNLTSLKFNKLDLRRAQAADTNGQQCELLIPFPQVKVISVERVDFQFTAELVAGDVRFFRKVFPQAKILYQHMFVKYPNRLLKSECSAPENLKLMLASVFVERDSRAFGQKKDIRVQDNVEIFSPARGQRNQQWFCMNSLRQLLQDYRSRRYDPCERSFLYNISSIEFVVCISYALILTGFVVFWIVMVILDNVD